MVERWKQRTTILIKQLFNVFEKKYRRYAPLIFNEKFQQNHHYNQHRKEEQKWFNKIPFDGMRNNTRVLHRNICFVSKSCRKRRWLTIMILLITLIVYFKSINDVVWKSNNKSLRQRQQLKNDGK